MATASVMVFGPAKTHTADSSWDVGPAGSAKPTWPQFFGSKCSRIGRV